MSQFMFGGFSGGYGGNDSFTKVLLHLDGTNGSTTFTDVNAAGVANTWAAVGSSALSTSNFKFGTSCLQVNPSFGVQTAAKTDLNVGSSDFAIDFWMNMNGASTSGYSGLVGYGNSTINEANWSWYLNRVHLTGKLGVGLSNGATQVWTESGITDINTGWHHIAMTRDAGTVRAFVDGILQYTFSANFALQGSVGFLKVGGCNSTSSFTGVLIDEVRYSIGTSRWTAAFTPPNLPYS